MKLFTLSSRGLYLLAFLHPYFRRVLPKKTKGRKTENCICCSADQTALLKNKKKIKLYYLLGLDVWTCREHMIVFANYTGETYSLLWTNLVRLGVFCALHAACTAC